MKPVVIFGAGQVAEVAHFYWTTYEKAPVAAFAVDAAYIREPSFKGLPVVAWETLADTYPVSDYQLFAPISYTGINALRETKYNEGKDRGYDFATFVHPNARTYGTPVGENCFIFEDNVIQPFTRIGNNVVLWSGNHIGHHSVLEDHVFIASHVVVSGNCRIGARCFLGVNATMHDNTSLGRECVVTAGAIVTEDLPDRSVLVAPKSEVSRVPSNRLRGF